MRYVLILGWIFFSLFVAATVAQAKESAKVITADKQGFSIEWSGPEPFPETAKLLRTFKGNGGYVRSAAFAPDGQSIVYGSYDKTLKLWGAEAYTATFSNQNVLLSALQQKTKAYLQTNLPKPIAQPELPAILK